MSDARAAGRGEVATEPVRVLLADDSAAVRRLLRIALEEGGYTIVGEAGDGAEALMLAQSEGPKVVVLDIAMPRMDGLEAISEIRRHVPGVKIVVLSAYSTSRMAEQAMAAGADAYVEKAAPDEELLAAIHRLFPDAPAPQARPRSLQDALHPSPAASAATSTDVDTELFQRSLLDALDEGVVVVDRTGAVRSANFMATVMLGVPTSRLAGNSLAALGLTPVAEDGTVPAEHEDPIATSLRTGRPQSGITLGLMHRGELVRWLRASVRPLVQHGVNAPESAIVSLVDITEPHRAVRGTTQDKHYTNEAGAHLAGAIDAIPVGVIMGSAIRDSSGRIVDFRFVHANQAAIDTAGRHIRGFIGRTALEMYPTLENSGLLEPLISLVETGEPLVLPAQPFEQVIDGRRTSGLYEIRINKLADGCIATFADVTGRERAVIALRQNEERMRGVTDAMPVGVVIVSTVRDESGHVVDFRYEHANPAAVDLSGIPIREFIGRRVLDVHPVLRDLGLIELGEKVIETGEHISLSPQLLEEVIEGKLVSGFYDIRISRLGDGCIATFADVTERERSASAVRERAERFHRANAELQRYNKELQAFAYGASHDIAEPLRVISGFARLLTEESAERLDERGQEFLAYITDAAQRGQALVDDLYEFAVVRTAEQVVTEVDVAAVVDRCLEDLATRVVEANAQVTVGPLPTVTADAGRLTHLFRNLLSNALKFVDGERQPRVGVSARRVDDGWQFAVADNGIGIAPANRERIFGMFQRLHLNTEYPGTGMGLAICRTVVEQSGGRLWVEENTGGGSVFYFTLPDDKFE